MALLAAPAAAIAQNPSSTGTIEAGSIRLSSAQPISNEAAGDADPLLYDAVLPEHRDRIYAATAGKVSRYRIDARVEPPSAPGEPARVEGSVELRYVNGTSAPIHEVFVRLYPNAPAYNEAEMTVGAVSAGGEPVTTSLTVDDTVLGLTLPVRLLPDAAIDLDLTYSATVPVRPTQTFGIFAVSPDATTVALGHWFPLLAGYDQHGWSLDPVSRNGDPIFSNVALFDVTLTTPAGWTTAATGTEIDHSSNGDTETRRLVTGPVRDVAAVVSSDLSAVSKQVGGTTVTSFFRPEHQAGGESVLAYGSRALGIFDELLIPYPYRQMTLVEVELHGAGGMEFPQLMFMGATLYDNEHPRNEHYLEFVTAHEVGHQWFYGLVGSNQHRGAFIDEGLVEYLSTQTYFSAVYGPDTGERQFGLEVLMWYLGALESRDDVIVNQPTDAFANSAVYGAAVYAKAAIGFAEINHLIGDDAFFAALRHYATAHEFGIGTPDDLLDAFEATASQEVRPVWNEWFNRAQGRDRFSSEDFQELQVKLGLR
jgi:hypothetical protein